MSRNLRASAVLIVGLLAASTVNAAAPPRTAAWCSSVGLNCPNGQHYAESICNTDPNVILCEDFDYPGSFFCDTNPNNFYTPGEYFWKNPGWASSYTQAVGCQTRSFRPTANFPPQPSGSPAGGFLKYGNDTGTNGQGYSANADQACLWGDCNPETQEDGSIAHYTNGAPVSKDIHIRFQYYASPDHLWPAQFDNKILFIYPDYFPGASSGGCGRPCAAIDAGMDFPATKTSCLNFYPSTTPDAFGFRYGDNSGNFKMYPASHNQAPDPDHQEYCFGQGYGNNSGPVTLTTPPNQPPAPGRQYRIPKGQWVTIEFRYKMSSPDVNNGGMEAWIDGVKVYSDFDLTTCGGNGGTDPKRCWIEEIQFLLSWYNLSQPPYDGGNGYTLADNLIISTSYIGPPGSPVANPMPPAKPMGLKITKSIRVETIEGRSAVDIQIHPEDGSEYHLFKDGEYYSKILGDRFLDIWAKPGRMQRYELRQYKGGKWVGVEILEAKT